MGTRNEPRGGQLGCMSRSIVLLKRYKPDGDAHRDFKSYDGRGASKALLLAIDRQSHRGTNRALRLHEMALEQVEREQAREGMVVA